MSSYLVVAYVWWMNWISGFRDSFLMNFLSIQPCKPYVFFDCSLLVAFVLILVPLCMQVFDCCKQCVTMTTEGTNCSIVSYGMSGAGKSHTLFGGSGEPGLVQHANTALFNFIKKRSKKFKINVKCWMACVSGDNLIDLLAKVLV